MRALHGADAYEFSRQALRSIFGSCGEMLEVWRGDEWVGGQIYKFNDGVFVSCALGWREGAHRERKEGVVGALYITQIDLGGPST